MKLLESMNTENNNVAQQVDDGALINFQAAGQRSGLLYGCSLTTSGNKIYIDPGVLMIRGYRLKIESKEEIYNASSLSFPSVTTTMYLILRITRTGHDATYSIFLSAQGASITTHIEKEEGSYDYQLAKVVLISSGIANVVSTIGTITASASGNTGTIGMQIPAPKLEIVGNTSAQLAKAFLCLGNKQDYYKFTSSYVVKFEFYRWMSKGKYRKRNGSSKIYTYKTGFVKVYDPTGNGSSMIGWEGDVKFKTTLKYSDITQQEIGSNGNFKYTKAVIDNMLNYVDGIFYDNEQDDGHVAKNSDVYNIRATRSKSVSPYGWLGRKIDDPKPARHNFFRFAFKAVVYDTNGKEVGRSDFSNSVLIRVNYRYKSALYTQDCDIGKFFRITLV